jgi:hypothetical protein
MVQDQKNIKIYFVSNIFNEVIIINASRHAVCFILCIISENNTVAICAIRFRYF